MPLDVIMPALGMAQDTGLLVSWLKKPGDKVAQGDVLFEVETDKSTMEVEAQAAGYLTHVSAKAGENVPVGQTIARISDSADASAEPAKVDAVQPSPMVGDASVPKGRHIIMPVLGMAQDSGVLVSWRVEPGAAVATDDVLFEVETDKSTVEVPAGASGFLAAIFAEAGDTVPTGQVIAIISDEAPDTPVSKRSSIPSALRPATPIAAAQSTPLALPSIAEPVKVAPQASSADGRVLASPKARRLAMKEGLDLGRLVGAGYPQPYHVRDIETLRSLGVEAPKTIATGATGRRLESDLAAEGFTAFARWAASETGHDDATGLLVGLAAASLRRATGVENAMAVALERFGEEVVYLDANGPALGARLAEADAIPSLRLRDLRGARITGLALGPEEVPVLTLMTAGAGMKLVLECGPGQLSARDAVAFFCEFAGRIEDPLRQML